MTTRSLLPLCLVAFLAATPASAELDLNLTAGMDFSGTIDVEDISADAETGYSLGLELVLDLPMFEVGGGLEYGFERGPEGVDASIDYRQLYAVARVTLFVPFYVMARAGYGDVSIDDLIDGDDEGGKTWSVGAGVKFLGRLKVEVMLNNFEAEIAGLDFDYETYSARLVYTF